MSNTLLAHFARRQEAADMAVVADAGMLSGSNLTALTHDLIVNPGTPTGHVPAGGD